MMRKSSDEIRARMFVFNRKPKGGYKTDTADTSAGAGRNKVLCDERPVEERPERLIGRGRYRALAGLSLRGLPIPSGATA